MDNQTFTLINIAVMTVVAWIIPLQFIPIFIWLERKGSAIIQDRIGPNRAEILGFRLFGMVHNFADVVKLVMKENIVPANVNRFYFFLAPFWSMTVSLLPLLVVPLAAPLDWNGHSVLFTAVDLNVGVLFILSLTSMGVYGIILAGWSSNNKFSLLGGLRSSAQMISYELSMGLAMVGLLMVYQDVRLGAIVETQGRLMTVWGHSLPLPNWGIFLQPVGFVLFLVASFAETNRNPFDLAEGESELVAGYHIEYSSVKFALFFMAEYCNMVVAAFVIVTLFLGGYQVPYLSTDYLQHHSAVALMVLSFMIFAVFGFLGWILFKRGRAQAHLYQGVRKIEPYLFSALCSLIAGSSLLVFLFVSLAVLPQNVICVLWGSVDGEPNYFVPVLQILCLTLKVLFFCWLFVWVRWTLPRFRYDQLMNLGWKVMLPLALLNLLVTGILILAQK